MNSLLQELTYDYNARKSLPTHTDLLQPEEQTEAIVERRGAYVDGEDDAA